MRPLELERLLEKRMHDFIEAARFLTKVTVDIIDLYPLLCQEKKAVIIVDIILWIQTIDSNRIVIPIHSPHYRCYVVDVVKMSNEKQIHYSMSLLAYFAVSFRQNGFNFSKELG
jgi:hypothetical protein